MTRFDRFALIFTMSFLAIFASVLLLHTPTAEAQPSPTLYGLKPSAPILIDLTGSTEGSHVVSANVCKVCLNSVVATNTYTVSPVSAGTVITVPAGSRWCAPNGADLPGRSIYLTDASAVGNDIEVEEWLCGS